MTLKVKKNNNKYGYCNQLDEIVIPCIFEEAKMFQHGFAIVKRDKFYGIIDTNGIFIIEPNYEDIIYLFDNFYAVRRHVGYKDCRYGIIDINGKIFIDFIYKFISIYNNRFLLCYKKAFKCNWRWEYNDSDIYNRDFVFIINANLKAVTQDNLIVEREGKYGIIESSGRTKCDFIYDEIKVATDEIFIVRKGSVYSKDVLFGVINVDNVTVIPLEYKKIEYEHNFFRCFERLEIITHSNEDNDYNYADEIWCNKQGTIIYRDTSHPIDVDKSLLAIKGNNGKWGIVNSMGKSIVSCIYDSITGFYKYLIIEKDGCLGLLSSEGNLIIPPLYTEIETIGFEPNDYQYIIICKKSSLSINIPYTEYCSECVFEIPNKNKLNFRIYRKYGITIENKNRFKDNSNFILRNKIYSEIISLESGIYNNSQFQEIFAITNELCCVKHNNKYGIYSIKKQELIIECLYENMRFEGGNILLVSTNNLWGICVLDDSCEEKVPCVYSEIKILDFKQKYFGVGFLDKESIRYKIIDSKNKSIFGLPRNLGFSVVYDSQFVYYNDNKILTSLDGKFGFISLNEYISIPFKYDEIISREDGDFDVRIDDKWGILQLNGSEKTKIKYSKPLVFKQEYNKDYLSEIEVEDVISKCKGIVSYQTGEEVIPCVYDNIFNIDKDIYAVGMNGLVDDYNCNFFSGSINYAVWGIATREKVLINMKFDCFKILGRFFVGCNHGNFVGYDNGEGYEYNDYDGIHSLFSSDGELLLTGASQIKYNEDSHIFIVRIGGKWVQNTEGIGIYTNYGEVMVSADVFNKDNSKILIVKENLEIVNSDNRTLIKGVDLRQMCFPNRTFIDGRNDIEIYKNYVQISTKSEKFLIRIEDSTISPKFKEIHYIKDDIFCIGNNHLFAIWKFESKTVEYRYVIVTKPVYNYIFVVIDLDENNYKIDLIDITHIENAITAISKIAKRDFYPNILKIEFLSNSFTLKDLLVSNHDKFDKRFLNMISQIEIQEDFFTSGSEFKDYYSYQEIVKKIGYTYTRDTNSDYTADSWDAMTDGMYGDMPDNFDGDYSFLGY